MLVSVCEQHPELSSDLASLRDSCRVAVYSVWTRAFSIGNRTFIVPMMDAANHACVDTTPYLMNHEIHTGARRDSRYFSMAKFTADFSILYDSEA